MSITKVHSIKYFQNTFSVHKIEIKGQNNFFLIKNLNIYLKIGDCVFEKDKSSSIYDQLLLITIAGVLML